MKTKTLKGLLGLTLMLASSTGLATEKTIHCLRLSTSNRNGNIEIIRVTQDENQDFKASIAEGAIINQQLISVVSPIESMPLTQIYNHFGPVYIGTDNFRIFVMIESDDLNAPVGQIELSAESKLGTIPVSLPISNLADSNQIFCTP